MRNKAFIITAVLGSMLFLAAVPSYSQPGWGWGYPYPYWGYYPPYYVETRGEVDIESPVDTDQVYINGAYAGNTDELDTMWLDPGRYHITIVRDGRKLVDRNIYVIRGEEVEINVR